MCRFVDEKISTLVRIVDFSDFCRCNQNLMTLLTNFVNVDFWQNLLVECTPEAKKVVDLHYSNSDY